RLSRSPGSAAMARWSPGSSEPAPAEAGTSLPRTYQPPRWVFGPTTGNQTVDVRIPGMRTLGRRMAATVEDRLRHLPGVVLLRPRQVGKTTLARRLVTTRGARAIYLDLEREADRRRLADAEAFLRQQAGKL